jgi:hypothetical protein
VLIDHRPNKESLVFVFTQDAAPDRIALFSYRANPAVEGSSGLAAAEAVECSILAAGGQGVGVDNHMRRAFRGPPRSGTEISDEALPITALVIQ